jgi:hypothetical protein
MGVTNYEVIEARSSAELNTLVAAAIADGYQPIGAAAPRPAPFNPAETVLVQTMVKGVPLDIVASAADFATAAQGAKADTAVQPTRTVNGHALSGNVTVTATDLTLGNVTNTSDANKPVSTAQQTALDLKAPISNPTFTGTTHVLATGAAHTADDIITLIQALGLCKQS